MNKKVNQYANKIAVIVPSLQRLEYLERLLVYFQKVALPYSLYIGDRNHVVEYSQRLKEILSRHNSDLRIQYCQLNAGCLFTSIKQLLGFVSEPYVLYHEDDHFVFPVALAKCADFLEKNRDYRAAHGYNIVANSGCCFPSWSHWNHYFMGDNTAHNPISRLKKWYKVGLTYLSVRRTAELREDLMDVGSYNDVNFDELLVNHLSLLRGKVKKLATLFFIRPYPRPVIFNIPPAYEWVQSQHWAHACRVYLDKMAAQIEAVGVNKRSAKELSQSTLSQYMILRFGGKIRGHNSLLRTFENKILFKNLMFLFMRANCKLIRHIKQI